MRYFDLHCDTLYKATAEFSSFNDNSNHISVDKTKSFDLWHQMCAIWIPDALLKKSRKKLFCDAVKVFDKEKIDSDKIKMYLAVENASMLEGDIDNISLLVENNVRYVTLTWNAQNELGGGADTEEGLSDFGRAVVKEFEHNNICVDLSHASDKLFYDVISIASKPVIVTHSNSRSVTNVRRNLSDEQFKIVRDMGSVVGLNFYKGFLNTDENKASIDDIILHTEHFLNLGGENTLAIGADFDGADMPKDINGIDTIPAIYQRFIKEFGENITKKIFFDNAFLYFTNFDIN